MTGSLLALGVAFALTAEGCSCGGGGNKTSAPSGPVAGPSSWYAQYRKPTSSNLKAVRASDPNTVIVAGDATSIFRSDDAGQTWTQLEHRPVSRGGNIASMDFSGAYLQCVGSDSAHPTRGRIWTATNGVLDFTTPDLDASVSPNVAAYLSVNVVSSSTYYALRSDGVVEQNVSGTTTTLPALPAGAWNSISFLGTTGVGYAAGNAGAVAMFNGVSWSAQTTPVTAPQYNLKKILFFDANNGYACGDQATILVTVNGGTTWKESNYVNGSALVLESLHFPADSLHGWVVGSGGAIAATTNGGGGASPVVNTNWQIQASGTTENLSDVWFSDNNDGYAVGDHGIVLRTTTAGVLIPANPNSGWLRAPPAASATDSLLTLNAVDFTNDGSLGLVAGNSGLLLRTMDGGTTWESLGSIGTNIGPSPPNPPPQNLLGVWIAKGPGASGNVAYACGSSGFLTRSANITAATPTWTVATTGVATNLNAVLFPTDDIHGAVCGASGVVLSTADGSTWIAPTTPPAPAAATWTSLSTDPTGNVFMGGTAGISAKSADAGVHWANLTVLPGGPPAINAIQSPTVATLFAGGSDNSVYRGSGAAAWSSAAPAGGTAILGLSFPSTTTGWLVNSPGPFTGGVWTTADGGVTWTQVYVHTIWQLQAIWASPNIPGLVYAVGQNGTLLKTLTGGQ